MSHFIEPDSRLRKRQQHQKRQRVSVTDEITTSRVRATTTAVVEEEDEPTTTRRVRTTAPVVETTTSVPVVAVAPTPATPSPQTTTQPVVPIATIPPTAPVVVASTSAPVVIPVPAPTTRASTSSRISASSSVSSVPSNAPVNNAASTKSSSSFPTGTVVGVVVAVLAFLALLGGFFFWKKRRNNRRAGNAIGGNSGYQREKSMDGSDIFPGGVNSQREKGSPPPQDYSMQAMNAHPDAASAVPARRSWSQTNNYAAMPLPSPAVPINNHYSIPVPPPSNNYASTLPQSASVPNGFAPPKAAMMGTPSTRSSVANPYGAIAAAGLTSPKLPVGTFAHEQQKAMPLPVEQEDTTSPFEDPKWHNKLFTVTRTFEPSMPDELVIYPGDTVKILMAYDDGWVLGENLSGMQNGVAVRGVFPRDCVEELIENANAEDQPLYNEPATVTRAPTLPPLNLGRDSQSFTSAMSTSSDRNSKQVDNRYSRASLAPSNKAVSMPSVEITSSEDPIQPQNKHLSASSSLNGAIDRFPATPARQLTPVVEDGDSSMTRSLKRTSSLMASRDQQDLFAQLGDVMGQDLSDDETEEQAGEGKRKSRQ